MITLFDYKAYAPDDQSIAYLAQIFGNVGKTVLPATKITILSTMFNYINTAVLILGAIIVTHTAITGLLKTAQQGEFLGKWDSMWVPIRTVTGIAALFPTASGYSLIQIGIMWFIIQGVGAADYVWTHTLKAIEAMGSPYGGNPDVNATGLSLNMSTLFQQLVCQATTKISNDIQSNNANLDSIYYCAANPTTSFCKAPDEQMLSLDEKINPMVTHINQSIPLKDGISAPVASIIQYSMGPDGKCGTLTFPDPALYVNKDDERVKKAIDDWISKYDARGTGKIPDYPSLPPVCPPDPNLSSSGDIMTAQILCSKLKAQQTALQELVLSYGQLAKKVAYADLSYQLFKKTSTSATTSSDPKVNTAQWAGIASYCSNNKISSAECCTSLAPTSLCQGGNQKKYDKYFPAASGPYPSSSAPTPGMSQEAIQKLIWPYYIQPGLSATSTIQDTMALYLGGSIVAAVAEAVREASSSIVLKDWKEEAARKGWLVAGSYYYIIAQTNGNNLQSAQPDLKVTASTDTTLTRSNYAQAKMLLDQAGPAQENAGFIPDQAQGLNALVNSTASSLVNSVMGSLTGGKNENNPLASVVSLGQQLILSATVIYPVWMAISVGVSIYTSVNVIALGTGLTENPLQKAWHAIFGLLSPLIMAYCAFCFSFGGMLAVYVPLIPYTIFLFGVIGWLSATIEAMVAAPFVALGILSPGGQSEMLGRAEPALMILLNTFTRPMLMVVGMMAAMLMSGVAIKILNNSFLMVMNSITSTAPTPVEMILFLVVYTMLVVTALNKCFSLIHMIPERILTWIGGQAVGYGESESVQSVRGGFDTAGASVGRATEGSVEKGAQVGAAGKKGYLESQKESKESSKAGAQAGKNPPPTTGSGSGSAGPAPGGPGPEQ